MRKSKTVRGRTMNSSSHRVVSGETVTAVTSAEALGNVISAQTGADAAVGALARSTKDYAKLRNKESETKKWFLKAYAVKNKRDEWNAAWEPLALAKGQEQIARFTQYFQLLQGISGPEAAQAFINPMEYPYLLADLMQIDSRLLNAPEEVARVFQAQQDKMNEQQDMLMQQQGAAPAQLPEV